MGIAETQSVDSARVREVEAVTPPGWRCEHGAALGNEAVRIRIVGPQGAPVVAALGGISAGRFVAEEPDGQKHGEHGGWWARLARPAGGLDTQRYAVLGLDFSPTDPSAPVCFTPADQARLLALALDKAGIDKLHGFVGASYGGMIGLAFARLLPARLQRLVVISAAHRPSAMGTAWRGVQRRIMEFAIAAGRPEDGVRLARELAMTTYRTPEEFAQRFTPGLAGTADVSGPCEYLIARGDAYAEKVTAARFSTLSAAIDRHDENPARIATETLLIAARSDRLTPVEDMRELAAGLAGPNRLVEIDSLYGHDAFLKEVPAYAETLARFLEKGIAHV